MRRKDREVTDRAEIRAIIAACDCCRLGLCGGGRAYVVPLDFGFVEEGGRCAFYFHGAQEGRKIDLIRETGWAAFEMDTGHEWVRGETALQDTSRFRCVRRGPGDAAGDGGGEAGGPPGHPGPHHRPGPLRDRRRGPGKGPGVPPGRGGADL